MNLKETILLTAFTFAFVPLLKGQQRLEAGVKIMNEYFYNKYGPGMGGQIVYRITKHSGIESGILYKVNHRSYFSANSFSFSILRENTVLLPLMYRFDAKILNLSAGGSTSYIINFKESEKLRTHETGRFEFAAAIAISKSFKLGDHWTFEPEIRSSAPIPEGGVANSLNFSLRKNIW